MRRIVFALLFSMLAVSARAEVIFTPTQGSACQDYSKPESGYWTCQGPGGYVVGLMDEGNVAAVAIGPRSGAPRKLDIVSQFRGAGQVFGPKVEWHTMNGKPHAAALRVWRLSTIPTDHEKQLQELHVFSIDGVNSCVFATVDAEQPDANIKAAAFGDEAMRHRCIVR
jgi:hypothetical protein